MNLTKTLLLGKTTVNGINNLLSLVDSFSKGGCRMPSFVGSNMMDQLQLRLRWVYDWDHPPGWTRNHFARPYTFFWLVLSGTKRFVINGKQYDIRPRDIVCIPPNLADFTFIGPSETGAFHYLALGCDAKVGPFDLVKILSLPYVASLPDEQVLVRLTELWYALLQLGDTCYNKLMQSAKLPPEQARLSSLESLQLNTLLYQLISELTRTITGTTVNRGKEIDTRAHNMYQFMMKNLDQPFSISVLANQFYISKSYLRRIFHQNYGTSPNKFFQLLRMQKARELLLNTDKSMNEISEQVGFRNQSQFSRFFKEIEGISPLAYRNRGHRYE